TTYLTLRQPPLTTSLFPYTTLFRSPEAAPLQVQVEPLEAQLFRARLAEAKVEQGQFEAEGIELEALQAGRHRGVLGELLIGYALDRKSTRLNSSHVKISYAVFCLKK